MTSTTAKHNFTGKVALVTGSSNGIGAAISIQLAQYGARVTITGRDAASLNKIAQKIVENGGEKPVQIVGDLLDDSLPAKLVSETIAKYGQLDILVNNAGLASAEGSLSNPNLLKSFDEIFKVNLRSVVQLTQLAVPHLEKTKGNIVNISSVCGLRACPKALVYCASKAALDMVTKTSALELGPKGIRVNSINPGPVFTKIGRSLANNENIFTEYEEEFKKDTVLQRLAQPEEIANLATFLVSDDARNITGSIMVSDGGFTVKH